ncbi:MAG: GMC family oxidoreductase N-terminal domain-containing protein, partial [Gemmatimonadota bacterium]
LYHEAGLRATSDKAIGILQGRGVGGSTLHNTGLVVPPPEAIVERWRRDHGFALDGPTLERQVTAAVEMLRARPIPAERVNRSNDLLRQGAEALGWRHIRPLHNRAECSGCGYCMLGCAYNRKFNAALTWLPEAVRAGARILADAPVTRIERASGDGWRVRARLTDAHGRSTGRLAVIDADTVVVAAGALATPALLRHSRLGGRRVGHGLRLHPSALVTGVFPEDVAAWRGLPQSVLLDEFASFRDDGRGGFLGIPFAMWPGLTAALLPGFGPAHREAMRDYPRFATTAVVLHDETAGRVVAARDGRPVARYRPDRADLRTIRHGVRALARLYLAAGAERVHLPYAGSPAVTDETALHRALERADERTHRLRLSSVHPQGSCPIGGTADRGVVDPLGAVYGEHALHVADTSLFPTSVGVPPQVTAMALGAAVAERIVDENGGGG